MGKAIMGAVVSLEGFIADDRDAAGPLFDWYGNGDVTWSFPGTDDEFRTTQASADFKQSHYRDVAAASRPFFLPLFTVRPRRTVLRTSP